MEAENEKFKTRLTFLILANLIALAGWALLFYRVESSSRSFLENSRELELKTQEERNLKNLMRLVEETADERAALDSFFVREENVTEFLSQLENLARQVRLSIDLISVAKEGENTLLLIFQTRGSFRGTYHFLSLIESLSHRLSFEMVSLKAADISEGAAPVFGWEGLYTLRLVSFISK